MHSNVSIMPLLRLIFVCAHFFPEQSIILIFIGRRIEIKWEKHIVEKTSQRLAFAICYKNNQVEHIVNKLGMRIGVVSSRFRLDNNCILIDDNKNEFDLILL